MFDSNAFAKLVRRVAAAGVLVAVLPGLAWPQPSGRQTTPDGRHVLVNRAEAGLQWAISYSPNEGTITGNVFDPNGGDPSYIWCERLRDDGVMDPAAVAIDWRCEGADPCTMSPCDASGWSDLGVVPLGGFFFLPARDPFVTLMRPGTYCDPIRVGFVVEFAGNPSWEVDTAICHYASMAQPTQTSVNEGEDIWIRAWNYALEKPVGGTAHYTVMLGDEVIYTEALPIPKPSGLLGPVDEEGRPLPQGICVRPSAPVPSGTQVSFNVQIREPETAEAQAADDSIPDLASPQHSTPGVIHHIDLAVSPNCASAENGRPLVTNDTWELVSNGLPLLP